MKKALQRTCFISTLMALLFPVMVFAGSNDPMDGYPLPAGTSGFLFYYNHLTADDFYSHGQKDSSDKNLTANIGIYRWVSYYDLGGMRNATNVIVPFGSASVDATVPDPTYHIPYNVHASSPSGLGDLILNQTAWVVNNPEQQLFVLGMCFVTVPTGEYDKEKDLNLLATNRWVFKPGFAVIKGITSKGTFLEVGVFDEIYTKNDKYTSANLEMKQDSLFKVETNLIQFLDPKTFVALTYYYDNGGETKVEGVKQDDKTKTHSLQLAWTRMVTDNTQFMVKYRSDLKVENGPKADTLGVRLCFLFPADEKK
jgi:hypothetical protein